MRFITITLSFLLLTITLSAQNKNEKSIRGLLATQTEAWNRGDIEQFMHGYWENDSLMFIGKSGVTYGWTNTLNNYKKGYPDTAAMGKLHFDLIQGAVFPLQFKGGKLYIYHSHLQAVFYLFLSSRPAHAVKRCAL